VDDVARERPHDARPRVDEHAVQAQAVAVGLPAHGDHAVVIVGEGELERLAGRQVERERQGDAIGFVRGRARQAHLASCFLGPEVAS
jgi:hypothetical protein